MDRHNKPLAKPKTGTKEWAEESRNIYTGCRNDCRYCYARYNALRFGKIKHPREWPAMVINKDALSKTPRNLSGRRIMFPTTHDIFIDTVPECIGYLLRWLERDNPILIVSKPDLRVMLAMANAFSKWKHLVEFRLTIGSTDDNVLRTWEPGAPDYSTRMRSAAFLNDFGFETSVSIEPYLDETVGDLIGAMLETVSGVVWVGKMNRIRQRVDEMALISAGGPTIASMEAGIYSDDFVKKLYETWKRESRVRWKDSIRKVVGLEEPETVG